MRSIKLGNNIINDESLPFFISEIGSNHQGDTEHCKELILASKIAGASAVKLQKRDNKMHTIYPTFRISKLMSNVIIIS